MSAAPNAHDIAAAKSTLRRFRPYTAGAPLVRVGGDGDGGYLLPDDFEGILAAFSPGVEETVSFDLDIAARGIASFLLDGSVDGLPVSHPLLSFEKAFLGPRTKRHHTSLGDWVGRSAPDQGDLLLQIDIEGAEYAALGATPDAVMQRFRMIAIEFHQFHGMFDAHWRAMVMPALDKLDRYFVPVHVHPNNHAPLMERAGIVFPRIFEVTFLRRDRLYSDAVPSLPHALDRPNVPDRPDYVMPPFWDV